MKYYEADGRWSESVKHTVVLIAAHKRSRLEGAGTSSKENAVIPYSHRSYARRASATNFISTHHIIFNLRRHNPIITTLASCS